MKHGKLFVLTLLIATCSLFFACHDPLNSLKPDIATEGRGYFSLSIDGASRTIMPAALVQSNFAAYRLEFFVAGTSVNPAVREDRTNANLTGPVGLNAGTWDLRVSAFTDAEKTILMAQGELKGIVIGAGETVTGSIILGPITDGGEGIFSWNVSYPADLTVASMTVTPLDAVTGTPPQTLYFVGGTPLITESSLTLNTGYYRVVFSLRGSDGKQIIHRETLHVYAHMESVFEYEFKMSHFANIITVTSGADSGPGSLRQAIADAPSDGIIVIDHSVGTIALLTQLGIGKNLIIEGNGVTITWAASWDAIGGTLMMSIGAGITVDISRIHFKDGSIGYNIYNLRPGYYGKLESCVFSGNNAGLGSNNGTLNVKGCTFYGDGAVISQWSSGYIYLEGNLFYRRNTGSQSPMVSNDDSWGGSVTSLGYNAIDVELGTGDTQSGWTPHATDRRIGNDLPVSFVSFRPFPNSGAVGIIDTIPSGYPTVDFYGNAITAPASAGAVQTLASGSGYVLDLTVDNVKDRVSITPKGRVSAMPPPSVDGLISGPVTITATPNGEYELVYWLVNGERSESGNPLSLNINDHTVVQAVFNTIFEVDNFDDTYSWSTAIPGTLRHVFGYAQDKDIIRFIGVTPGTSVVRLINSRLDISKNITIEGNGITITRDPSWTSWGSLGRLLLYINDSANVTISRVHFKDGGPSKYGRAIQNYGNMNLESCIFSGNEASSGGAVGNYGTMSVKGCTFYGNSAALHGGAITNNFDGTYANDYGATLTLTGNLFYGNTIINYSEGNVPVVVYNNGGMVTSHFNVVDAELGTGNDRYDWTTTYAGWNAHASDTSITDMPLYSVNFKPLSGRGAVGIINTIPAGYPTVDFYGNTITAPASAGAVQALASGSGFVLDLSVNDSERGSVSATPSPDADGIVFGNATVTATPDGDYEVYWLVNGKKSGPSTTLNVNMTDHFNVQAVFSRVLLVSNFNGTSSEEGTLRYAFATVQNDDIIRFTGVTPGISTVMLTNSLSKSYINFSIEGNGITITRDPSATNDFSISIDSGSANISRVHFKDGVIFFVNSHKNLTLESCIFSGNKSRSEGGAIYSRGTLNVKGCTFYGNTASSRAGAILNAGGTLILEGNLFYGNTSNGYAPVVYGNGGTITSNGYNVVDVPLGTGDAQSGWNAHATDKTLEQLLGSNATSPFVATDTFAPVSELGSVITTPSADFPTTDFYGNERSFPGAPGAVK